MRIRQTNADDIECVLRIFDSGRRIMRSSGNYSQWPAGYPGRENVLKDIGRTESYVIEEGGRIVATFVLQMGAEPTYGEIFGGEWSCGSDYGTIHRIAKAADAPSGIFDACLAFCLEKIGYIRIDTHEDNVIMEKLLRKNGFVKCGTIYLGDGSPRLAFDLKKC